MASQEEIIRKATTIRGAGYFLTFAFLGAAVTLTDANRWTVWGVYATVAVGAIITATGWIASWVFTKLSRPSTRPRIPWTRQP